MTMVAADTTPRGLVWAFASVSSIAIHTALAAAILTAAHFAKPAPPETKISIATLESTALAASAPQSAATVAPAASSATAIRAQGTEPERIAATETARAVSGRAEPNRVQAAKTMETGTQSANADIARTAPAADIARPAEQTEVAATASRADPVDEPPVAETAAPAERPALATPVETAAPAPAVQPAVPIPAARAQAAVPVQPLPAQSVARAQPAQTTQASAAARVALPPAAVEAEPPAIAAQPARPAATASVERIAPATAPQAVVPMKPAAPQAVSPNVAPAPQSVAPAAASQPAKTVAGLVTAPAKPAPAEGRGASIARFLRGYQGGRCFLAVQAGGERDLHLRVFSDQTSAFSAFQSQSAGAVDVYAEPAPVGEAQCLALNFARSLPRYPDFGLRIELDSADVASGGSLTGRLVNPEGASVYLLTVDDDGMVVKANRSLKPVEEGSRPFAIQMFLTDTPKTPTQLLIAISADRPVDVLETLKVAPAADLFARLKTDDATMDFAIVAFVVR